MKIDQPIDIVVTYVDDKDEVWRKSLSQFNTEYTPSRWQNWNMFRYWFRGVEKFMPFIRTVHVVVSNIEQIPPWLDKGKVHVVMHQDIIPKQLLPTFNSTTIEMFLHNIDGLSERFLYSNDDMLPFNEMDLGDFFDVDGKPIYELVHRAGAHCTFRMQCENSYRLAVNLSGHEDGNQNYFYIKHSIDPMLKSCYDEVHEKAGDVILGKCTKFREPWNFTQYLFPDYAIMTDRATIGKMDLHYVKIGDENLLDVLKNSMAKVVCINDCGRTNLDESQILEIQNGLLDFLNAKYPNPSSFEL